MDSRLNEILNNVLKQNIDCSDHKFNPSNGYSGKKILKMLRLLTQSFCDEDNVYLEIGVFRGLTLLNAAESINNGIAYGIDNFSQFDPKNENFSIVKNKIKNMNCEYKVKIINDDFEHALINLEKHIDGKKIGVYFIDGPHDYRSQLMCLLLAKHYLSDNSVIVIDDCNYAHVRQANYDFLITHKEYKLVFEAYTRDHPKNMNYIGFNDSLEGFWNGVNVIIKDQHNHLSPMYPELNDFAFANDHEIRSSKYFILAPQALNLVRDLIHLRPINVLKNLIAVYYNKKRIKLIGKYDNMNTYGDNLPSYKVHRQIKDL